MKTVVVLNQFALPRTQGGGTRHIDLFGRLTHWSPTIIAGNRNHYTQQTYATDDPRFVLVGVPPQRGPVRQRALGWLRYDAAALVKGLRLGHIDVVYASTPHLLAPIAGAALARLKGCPLVVEVRDLWPQAIASAGIVSETGRLYRALTRLERWVYHRADRLVVVTGGWESHLTALGVDPHDVTVIPNGTETTEFAVDATRESLRAALGFTGFTAVFAGAHGPKDGIDLILDAARDCPDISVVLIGDGPVKEAAQRRAEVEGLDNIRFVDPVSKNDLPAVLRAADVGIHAVTPLPVLDKGMSPNKLFDYLAAGLPLVSNAQAALASIVSDGEVGAIGGPDSLSDGLRAVFAASEGQRRAWAARGQELIAARFSRAEAARHLEALLDDIAARGTR